MKKMSLDKLPLNTEGTVINLYAKDNLRRRFLDLGLVAGTKLKPIFISPSGDPRAYEFRSSLIAIRKDDARLLEIELWGNLSVEYAFGEPAFGDVFGRGPKRQVSQKHKTLLCNHQNAFTYNKLGWWLYGTYLIFNRQYFI